MVKSAITTRTTATIGTQTDLMRTTQCGWSLRTRFSPGSRLLMAAYCPLSQAEEVGRPWYRYSVIRAPAARYGPYAIVCFIVRYRTIRNTDTTPARNTP